MPLTKLDLMVGAWFKTTGRSSPLGSSGTTVLLSCIEHLWINVDELLADELLGSRSYKYFSNGNNWFWKLQHVKLIHINVEASCHSGRLCQFQGTGNYLKYSSILISRLTLVLYQIFPTMLSYQRKRTIRNNVPPVKDEKRRRAANTKSRAEHTDFTI